MPLHSDCLAVHELYRQANRPPLETLSPPEARDAMLRARALLAPDPPEVAEVRDLRIGGAAGTLGARLYRPRGAKAGDTLPGLVYFHGGGWVIGDLETHDTVCRELSNAAGAVVVSVDYRLAPEHPFPAAPDDAIASTRWIAEHARDLGIAADRIGVGGDSAGGNLALVAAIALRGSLPSPLRHMLLFYPAVDAGMQRPSITRNADVLPLTRAAMDWFYSHYVPQQTDRRDWRLSPLGYELRGLPAAHVLTAGYDVLCDEGLALADALAAAGSSVTRSHFPGHFHGFLTMGRIVADAGRALTEAGVAVRSSLSTG
jgi:acetyl esterase